MQSPTAATPATKKPLPAPVQIVATHFYREIEVCAFLGGINHSTIWRWIKKGAFPAPAKLGRCSNRWSGETLLDYMRDPEGWTSGQGAA